VYDVVEGICHFDRDVVHLLHKMDVFDHELPLELKDDLMGFKAFLTQNGERNVSLELVSAMFKDRKTCIAHGQILADAMSKRTDGLADSLTCIADTEKWCVLFTLQGTECRPVDLMYYQKRIDGHIDGRPTLVITQDEQPLSSGLYNLGLRRAGDNLDISQVAGKLKQYSEAASGGGHPFAGGVQMHQNLQLERIKEMAVEVMGELFE